MYTTVLSCPLVIRDYISEGEIVVLPWATLRSPLLQIVNYWYLRKVMLYLVHVSKRAAEKARIGVAAWVSIYCGQPISIKVSL